MPITLKTPIGCLAASWHRVADDTKFGFRANTKSSVLELANSGYADPYDTTPVGGRMTAGKGAFAWSSGSKNIYPNDAANIIVGYYNAKGPFANFDFKVRYLFYNLLEGVVARVDTATGAHYAVLHTYSNRIVRIYRAANWTDVSTILVSSPTLVGSQGAIHWMRFQGINGVLRAKVWLASGAEPTTGGIDGNGWTVCAYDVTYTSGRLGVRWATGTSSQHWMDDFTINDFDFDTTSPVQYDKWDSGQPGTAWAAGVVKVKTRVGLLDTGDVRVKEAYSDISYGVGDEAVVDALASALWLLPDASDEITLAGGVGRYRYLLYQFNNGVTVDCNASLVCYDSGQDFTITAGGGPVRVEVRRVDVSGLLVGEGEDIKIELVRNSGVDRDVPYYGLFWSGRAAEKYDGVLDDANPADTLVPGGRPCTTTVSLDLSNLVNAGDDFELIVSVGAGGAERVVAHYGLTSDGTDLFIDFGG